MNLEEVILTVMMVLQLKMLKLQLDPVLWGQPDDPLTVEVVAVALRVEGGAHQARGLQYSNFN